MVKKIDRSSFAELTYLRLVKLDISGNRISVLPNEMRKMKSLVDFRLSDNPLTSPPASVSTNVFAMKRDRDRSCYRIVDQLFPPPFFFRSYAFAGERTSLNIWRDRRRNTREPEVAVLGEHLWTLGATRLWTRGPTGDTTWTVDTARATASTNVGPKRFTARLVSSSFFSLSSYLFVSSSSPGSTTSFSATKLCKSRYSTDNRVHTRRKSSVVETFAWQLLFSCTSNM